MRSFVKVLVYNKYHNLVVNNEVFVGAPKPYESIPLRPFIFGSVTGEASVPELTRAVGYTFNQGVDAASVGNQLTDSREDGDRIRAGETLVIRQGAMRRMKERIEAVQ